MKNSIFLIAAMAMLLPCSLRAQWSVGLLGGAGCNVHSQDVHYMTAFRQWVYTESSQKIVFVYGSNDPWTGGAIDAAAAEANPNIALIVDPGGFHTDYFLNPDYFAKESSQQIQTSITSFLGK